MTAQPLWRVASPDHFLWAQFDGEYVIFHRPSGKTHFLNSASALLLGQVLCSPKQASAAARELADEQNIEFDPQLTTYVESLLRRLEELGLVDRIEDTRSL